MRSHIIFDPFTRLAELSDPSQQWLRCDKCSRFFQFRSGVRTRDSNRRGCPFRDCIDYGCDGMVMLWDDVREPDDPRWPSSPDQLEHGMRSPEMEPFYRAQIAMRISTLVDRANGSPELRAVTGDEPARYVRGFLQMMADLCWDLTEPSECGFSPDVANELIGDTPVWCRTSEIDEAPRMAAEVRASFAFAARTGAIEDAAQWSAFLSEIDLADRFAYTMETDRRLQPGAAKTRKKRRAAARRDNRAKRTRKKQRARRKRR